MSKLKFNTLVKEICDYLEADKKDVLRIVITPGMVEVDIYTSDRTNFKTITKPWEMS